MRELWKCPTCGHRFVTSNIWHSCGRYRIEVDGHFWLKRRVTHPRVTKVEHLLRRDWIHWFRLNAPADLDGDLVKLLKEAYEVGKGSE